MIKVLSSQLELSSMGSIWEAIYNEDPLSTPFQKFSYITNSITFNLSEKDSLYIVMVKDAQAKQWVAIFPLYLDKSGCLRYINARHTDFCRPIILPRFNNFNLYKEVAEHLNNDTAVRRVILDNVQSNDPLLAAFKPTFRYFITHDLNYYSLVHVIPKDSDKTCIDAFRNVPSKRRGKLRKIHESVKDCQFDIHSISQKQPYPKNQIESLVNKMLSDGIRVKEYFSDRMLAFWEDLYLTGVVDIAILSNDGKPAACSFLLINEKNTEYIEWLILYQDKSWNVAICLCIEEYIYSHEPHGIFNFARGIYDYKLTNFHPDVKPLFSVKIAKTRWGHIKNMAAVAFHYSKPIIKSFLGQ